ncbi:hypothetical protein BD324DRAFT_628099 [Kockovaella imperatae]|uniref:Uncharacterized protein n=1 Tax=Kockovaella imperatae TaxID=4999 RepID=A0A1Y1UDZ6_9TREE|nr:hypothetical protein BD324DRAFT_628099 [Kockovaella imperatae]ORX36263.1 hypothetical protein BD324DRAFT_628099 [Kockovaella imperatae]
MCPGSVRVAVIGAGASGLAQLKQLLDAFARPNTPQLDVVVYESQREVGGTWFRSSHDKKKYIRHTDSDGQLFFSPDAENPSPMYDGLRTNLPYDLMSYRDFPMEHDDIFPDQPAVERYLRDYAKKFDLYKYIRFNTPVKRLYRHGKWRIETDTVEDFDFVCVANGHYADSWIPLIPGLDSFPGEVLHSRYYRCPEDYAGKSVMVVGSFASGSDLSRQLAGLNLTGRSMTVYLSSSGSTYSPPPGPDDPPQPWREYIRNVPLISRIDETKISFEDGSQVDDVDTLIFATGYRYSLPFCKAFDEPWKSTPPLDRIDGSLSGLSMRQLDELLLFLKDDRTISFPVLQYQIVPFPLAEVQARLTAFLWAGLFMLPEHLNLPSNPSNHHSTPPATPPDTPVRKVVSMRQNLVFGAPYEFIYAEYLMDLMRGVDGDDTPSHWQRIEPWRRERRADKALRRKLLGY